MDYTKLGYLHFTLESKVDIVLRLQGRIAFIHTILSLLQKSQNKAVTLTLTLWRKQPGYV